MIHLLAKDVASAVKGELLGDGSVAVEGAAGLDEASEKELSFFHNTKYIDALQKTKARVVLIPQQTNGTTLPQGKTLIRVPNPQWAFAQVLGLIDQQRQHHPKGVHPKAHVEPSATIGAGTVVYPGCYIGHNARVGKDCLIYPNVVLREDTEVGDQVIIHAGAVLGADGYGFATLEGRHHKIPQIGRVVIENDVEIGANVTIDRATTGETRVGTGTKIDNLVHIAHNVHIGRDCLIVAQAGLAGSTKVGHRVTLGGQVGIVGHLTIGDGAVIAAQSGIMNDVEPGAVLFGSPARPHKQAMKLQAIYGRLEEIYDAFIQLKKKYL
jgi:UDP-3-O-[3-hydroxymyristoyl] glucosamine N-acyltransferase